MQLVLLAGGYGTRLRTVTNGAKCLVHVRGRPILWHVIWQFAPLQLDEVIVVAGFDGDAVCAYVAVTDWPGRVIVEVERQPHGTAPAVRSVLHRLDERFLLANADTLIEGDVAAMARYADEQAATLCVGGVRVNGLVADYGVLEVEGTAPGRLRRFVEKPRGRRGPAWVNAGVYVVTRSSALAMRADSVSFERDVVQQECSSGSAYVFPLTRMLDLGTPDRLQEGVDAWVKDR